METETFYHIYNHANGDENMFRTEENYFYFLKRYAQYVNPIADTYAYCLMPNHFHFLVRIKENASIKITLESMKKDLTGFENLSGLVSKQFSNLFNAYSKAFNQMYERKGSLFNRPFKNIEVKDITYFTKLVHYIHANPVHHGFVKSMDDWPYSSYSSFISNKNTMLKREEVLDWFNGKDEFIKYHHQPIDPKIDFDY